MAAAMQGAPQLEPPFAGTKNITPDVARSALAMLRGGAEAPAQANPFGQAASPINLLAMGGTPPTAPRIPTTLHRN